MNFSDNATASSAYYAAGRFDSSANDWALSSVNYQAFASDSYAATQSSISTTTGGNSSYNHVFSRYHAQYHRHARVRLHGQQL